MTAESDRVLERLLSLHPKIIDLTLGRVERLLAELGHPERNLPPVIHVAGTNGKGSVIAMIRAGLEAAGRRVHVYTSPHLARFHERIRLAGTLISEDALTAELEHCERVNGAEPITYFEITTAAAINAMAKVPADFTLLEVGLGGRLDATNVVDRPALTCITPVSYDHQQYLGETLAEIAAEKAGILKPGVPCIVAPQQSEAHSVIASRAVEVEAPLIEAGRDWQVQERDGRVHFQDHRGRVSLPVPRLIGAHQIDNAGCAIAALRYLGFGADVCAAALSRADWPARLQRLTDGPLARDVERLGGELWLDGGHNPAAGEALAAALSRLPPRPLHLVCGMLRTKDTLGFLRPLAPLADGLSAVSIPGETATLSAGETATEARAVGLEAREADGVAEAVASIASNAPGVRILICGSLYLAGHVLRENR